MPTARPARARELTETLSRRERQIMDYLFRQRTATAADVLTNIPDPPSYSAVQALLATLEAKGYVRHWSDGPRYMYEPTTKRETAQSSALHHLVKTFFDGSIAQTVSALLTLPDQHMSPEELEGLTRLVERARRDER